MDENSVRDTWVSQIFTKSNCSSFSAKFQLWSWECSKGKVRISRERRTFDYPHFSTAPVRSQPYQMQMTMCSCYKNCNVSYFLFFNCFYIGQRLLRWNYICLDCLGIVNWCLQYCNKYTYIHISNTIHVIIKHRFVLCTACFLVLRVGKSSKYIAFSRL